MGYKNYYFFFVVVKNKKLRSCETNKEMFYIYICCEGDSGTTEPHASKPFRERQREEAKPFRERKRGITRAKQAVKTV